MDDNRFKIWQMPEIKESELTRYHWKVQHADRLILGRKTDIGSFTYINAQYGVVIEDDVQIGSHCSIYSFSTIDSKQGRVVLKKNCRIGMHSGIMPGVTVGENSIIGAFSFVNKDIPSGQVWAGVPARFIMMRKDR